MSYEDIVDRIYAAAVVPELWADLLDALSVRYELTGGILFTINDHSRRGVCSKGNEEIFNVFMRDGWVGRSEIASRAVAKKYAGFVRDQDLFTPEEMETEPIYRDLLRPFGFGSIAGSVVDCPNGDQIALTFQRKISLGPTPVKTLNELDALRPHLARAAVFSGRLDVAQSQARVATLSALGLPGAVLTGSGKALAANPEFEKFRMQISIGANDQIHLPNLNEKALVAEAFARPRDLPNPGRSIPLKGGDDLPPAVLHVLPIRKDARDVFSSAAWLLIITPLGASSAPDASILCALFDLTPAESNVAREIVRGRTISEIADLFGLHISTIRNQLASIFLKTGVSRQADLILLCSGAGILPKT